MTKQTETRTFAKDEGTSAMFYDIAETGRGATMKVERTPEGGWQSTAAFDDEARVDFFGELNLKGFQGYHSGGGCRAMSREFGEGGNQFQILITGGEADMPEPNGEWFVGCYDPDCDCFHEAQGTGNADLFAAVDAAVVLVDARIASETAETRAKRDAEHAALVARYS